MGLTPEEAVALPARLREALDLGPGDAVEVEQEGEQLHLKRSREQRPPTEQEMSDFRAKLERLSGTADSGWTTDQILDMTRGADRHEAPPGE